MDTLSAKCDCIVQMIMDVLIFNVKNLISSQKSFTLIMTTCRMHAAGDFVSETWQINYCFALTKQNETSICESRDHETCDVTASRTDFDTLVCFSKPVEAKHKAHLLRE